MYYLYTVVYITEVL